VVEAAFIGALVLIGAVVLRASGARALGVLVGAALPAGIGVVVLAFLVSSVLRLPVRPAWWLAAGTLVAVGWLVARARDLGLTAALSLLAVVGGWMALVPVALATQLVHFTPDSFEYVALGGILHATGDVHQVVPRLVETRQLTLPILHGTWPREAGLYLRSLSPLIAISGLVSLAFFGERLLRARGVTAATRWVLVLGSCVVLATNNRFVWHAFYVNGHLLFGVYVLLILGSGLLLASEPRSRPWPVVLVLASIAGLVPLRPESWTVAVIVIAPLVVSPAIALRDRRILLGGYGAITLLHQLVTASVFLEGGRGLSAEVAGGIATGALALLAAWMLPRLDGTLRRVPSLLLGHLAVWLLLALLAVRRPGILTDSLEATWANLTGEGLWGSSLLLLGAAAAVTLGLRRWPGRSFVAFPLVTFVPLAFVLAVARGSPYRVGDGDSLNRMWVHVLLLAVLGLVLAAASSWPRWPSPRVAEGIDHVHERERAASG
jgi:hypothetical protein